MKVSVYTIALNEEHFVERWYESAKDADHLLIADTGSTDGTVEKARSLGIEVVQVGIRPWRFDDARNASLAAIPLDVDFCIALDMDEVLQPGWREALESTPEGVTRPRYKYTWSWNPDGSPGLEYGGDKIHARKGYRWKHPVHEVAMAYGDTVEVQAWIPLEIHHHPDATKSRAQYAPMLKMAVDEDPTDDRNAFYYARELYFAGRNEEAAAEFKRHLTLPKARWAPERAASERYLAKVEPENVEMWLKKSLETSPRKEGYAELALYYYQQQRWEECLEAARGAIAITEKPLDYLCEAHAWGAMPYDVAAVSAYALDLHDEAIQYGAKALEIEPENDRLRANMAWYMKEVKADQPA